MLWPICILDLSVCDVGAARTLSSSYCHYRAQVEATGQLRPRLCGGGDCGIRRLQHRHDQLILLVYDSNDGQQEQN